MPYVITTRQLDETTGLPGPPMDRPRAVATLEEAQALVPKTEPALDERGATYHLIDGTVIEVEQASEAALYNAIRSTLCCPACGIQQSHVSGSDLIAAFNAAQRED